MLHLNMNVCAFLSMQCFCSNFCYKASKEFELQISKAPLWVRQDERYVWLTPIWNTTVTWHFEMHLYSGHIKKNQNYNEDVKNKKKIKLMSSFRHTCRHTRPAVLVSPCIIWKYFWKTLQKITSFSYRYVRMILKLQISISYAHYAYSVATNKHFFTQIPHYSLDSIILFLAVIFPSIE